ncbi:MAG: M56 family metallopeptidase, partial [Arenimonas sp.]|nr:M56 family metallopeptidase [Arenimonas sp.]
MTSVLVSYAIEHLFLSGLLLAVAAAVVRWVPAHARHPWLLGALVVAVAGPLLPLAAMLPGDAPTHLSSASALPRVAGGDIGLPSAWAAALLAVWASIGLVRMCRLAKAWRSAGVVARLSHRSLEIERQHADVLHRGTRVHLSPCFGPAVLGVLNPCIVLPARVAAQLPYEAMRAVIAHESEHIARRDPAWHALERASLALFWWNPAMAQLARWLDQARELACDAGAARRAGNRVQYAEALLCVAVHARGAPPKPALAALAMASGTPLLEHRIDALLQPGHHRRGTRSAVGCLLALAMLSAWAAASTAAPAVRMPTTDLRADEADLPPRPASARCRY